MPEQNEETKGEIRGAGAPILIDLASGEAEAERERQQEATELGIQRERAEASGDGGTYSEASEALIDDVTTEEEQGEPVEIDFATLSTEDQISVLFTGLYEMNARLSEAEQRLILLAQSFVRILEAAGVAEDGAVPEPPPIEVARTLPTMATKIPPR